MACEDYPCCGHADGDCPTIDEDGHRRWTCVICGGTLPRNYYSAVCHDCHKNRRNIDGDYINYPDN
jgi:hypothetical protein